MSAVQVREVLLTTANHKNADGTDMEGWANVNKTTPAEGEVSDRMGWGVPDLEKGMYGLGQTLGKFDYNLRSELDVCRMTSLRLLSISAIVKTLPG